jgi:SAM-dependent methyltransferase
MNSTFENLRDPINGNTLFVDSNTLKSSSGKQYPIVNGIPRFVVSDNYSDDFGSQWNRFPKTQIDSSTGLSISEDRLSRCLRGNISKLKGKRVLEAGSGAGRFTEILLKHGAIVDSFDYSNAVEANAINNGQHKNLTLVQADIRHIPFEKASYDYVICLGVLQHTPSPEESISCLWEMVKPGGALVIDNYMWKWTFILPPPFGGSVQVYRWFILRLPKRIRYKFVKRVTDFFFPIHWKFRDSLFIQRILRRVSPVHFYYPDLKLRDREMHYEWSLLDTHDGTTDYYKHRRKPKQIRQLLEKLGAVDIDINIGGTGFETFCRKQQG